MRHIGSALLVLSSLGQACFGAEAPAAATKNSIAVLDLANRNPGDGFDWLSKGLADMIISDLAGSKKLLVVDRERTQDLVRELELDQAGLVAAGATRVGQVAKVDWVAFGSYSCRGGELAVELLLLDLASQKALRVEQVDGQLVNVSALEPRLVRSLLEHIQLPMTEQELRAVTRLKTESLPAFEHYSRGLAMFDEGRWYDTLVETLLARKADPLYVPAASRTALLYHELGADEHAIVEYEALLAADRDDTLADIEYFRAACLLDAALGKRKKAIALLEHVLARYPQELPTFDVRQPSPLLEDRIDTAQTERLRITARQYTVFMRSLERLGRWHLEQGQELEAARFYSWLVDFYWKNNFLGHDSGEIGLTDRYYTQLYWRLVAQNRDSALRPATSLRVVKEGVTYDRSTKPSHGRSAAEPLIWLSPPGQEIASIEFSAKPRPRPDGTAGNDGGAAFSVWSVQRRIVGRAEVPHDAQTTDFPQDGSKHVVPMQEGTRSLETHMFTTGEWELRFSLRPWSGVEKSPNKLPCMAGFYLIPADGKITLDERPFRTGVSFVNAGEHRVAATWPNGSVRRITVSIADESPEIVLNSRCEKLSRAALAPVGHNPCLFLDARGKIWMIWDQNESGRYGVSADNDSDLYAATSLDGIRWSTPRRLPVSSSARDLYGQLQQDPQGVYWLVWVAYHDREKSLCIAHSTDGIVWSFPRKIVLPDAVKRYEKIWGTKGSFAVDQRGILWLEWGGFLLRSKDGQTWDLDSTVHDINPEKGVVHFHGLPSFLAVDGLNNLLLLTPTSSHHPGNDLWRRSDGTWKKLGRVVDGIFGGSECGWVSPAKDGSFMVSAISKEGIFVRRFAPSGKPAETLQLTDRHHSHAILMLPEGRLLLGCESNEGIVAEVFKLDEDIPGKGSAGQPQKSAEPSALPQQ